MVLPHCPESVPGMHELPAIDRVPNLYLAGQNPSSRTDAYGKGGEHPAVRAERQASHGGGVRGQGRQLTSVCRVPDLDFARSVHTSICRGQPPAVGTECHAGYEVLVPGQAKALPARRDIPDFDFSTLAKIAAGGSEQLAVRRERHAAHGRGVAGQGAHVEAAQALQVVPLEASQVRLFG